jgi:hypothetical protein
MISANVPSLARELVYVRVGHISIGKNMNILSPVLEKCNNCSSGGHELLTMVRPPVGGHSSSH